jgi:ferredoxin-type protein NapH
MTRQQVRKSILGVSFLLFQIRIFHLFFSPVLIVFAASQGIINGSFLIYAILFLTSLYFGRAFCSWVCPGGGLQELCSLAVHKRAKGGGYNRIKYVIWGLWVSAIVLLAIRAGGFHAIDPFFGLQQGTRAQKYILFFGVIALVVPASFLFGRWASCHYMCWMVPFMVIGTRIKDRVKWPSLHLKVDRDVCTNCEACDQHCPMSLDVCGMVQKGNMRNSECILCGNCVDSCLSGAIRYSFAAPE